MGSDVLPWLEYTWAFDFPVGMFRAVLERLRGTPSRLEDLVRGASEEAMRSSPQGRWCAKEHAGHLWTVDALWQRRIAEYLRGEAELTAADMANRATQGASYESAGFDSILSGLRTARAATLALLDPLPLTEAARVAHHPRLDRPMRLVDLCFFAAEHDDHHLAMIRELLEGRPAGA
jgi:uncharacterized damage-inducible protein DinB